MKHSLVLLFVDCLIIIIINVEDTVEPIETCVNLGKKLFIDTFI